MESYSTKAILSCVDKGFTSTMNSAEKSLLRVDEASSKASTGVLNIAKGVGVFKALSIAADQLKESLSGAIDRFDTMNRYPKIMGQIGFSTKESNKSIKELSDGIQGLPTSLDGMVSSTQKIALLTGNLDKATDTSLALNNAFLSSGSAAEDAERGMIQYTQMLSKGTVDMQSWRTVQETMGPALHSLAEAFGYAGESAQMDLYGALQSGQITFSQLNDKLIELDGGVDGFAVRAKTASVGIRTSFSNMGIAVTRGMANTIQSINDTMNKIDGSSIQGKIDSVGKGIDGAFKGIAQGASVAVRAIDLLGPSITTATAGFVAFRAAMVVQDHIAKINASMLEAKTTIDAFSNASKLATQTTLLKERATRKSEMAERLNSKAISDSEKALKSGTIANESSIAAITMRKAADQQAAAEVKVRTAEEKLAEATIKLRAREEAAAAAATKSKTVQERAAATATKAKADVDRKALVLEEAKVKASKTGATAAQLSAKAEILDAAATETKTRADKDSLGASLAKTNADKARAAATKMEAAAEVKGAAATEVANVITAKSSMLVIAKTAVLGVLSGKLGVAAAAQWAWNAALTANPIGAAIMATTALIAVTAGVAKAVSKLDTTGQNALKTKDEAVQGSKDLVESLDSSSKAYKDNVSDISESANANKKLAENVSDLSAKENKSTQDKLELKAQVDALNSSMEGLNLQCDEETGALNMSTEALMKKVDAYKAQETAQTAQERYVEVMKEQMKIEEEQSVLKEKRNEFEKEWQKLNNDGPAAMSKYIESINEMKEQESALSTRKQELAQSEEHLKGVMVESQQAQAEAMNSSAESQKISLESLSETQQTAITSMKEQYQSLADQATNMFDVLSDESELSVAQMTENLQENQRVISDWATNIEALAKRGVDEGLLEQLRQAGPESAGYVKAMVQASDAELQPLSAAFANNGGVAVAALKTAFSLSDVPQGVMDMVTETRDTLNEQITSADFASIGRNVGQGLGQGISESADQASTASTGMAQGVNDAAANTMGINSPSTVFIGYGQNLVQGLVIGVQSQSGAINAIMGAVMASAGQTAANTLNNAVNSMASASTASFSRISSAAKVEMSAMSAEVSRGAKDSTVAIQGGMKTMSISTQSGMRTMQLSMTSGMRAITQAIGEGMNVAKSNVADGCSDMVSTVSSLRGSFYSSGYFASMGLENGINAGAGAAISAAQRVANSVAEIMRSALRVHSPSRITRKIGGYASEGLAIGILDGIRMVETAASNIAEAAVPTGDIARRMTYAGERTTSPSRQYSYGGDTNSTYTIIVPIEVDGREFAKATATYTQEELNQKEKFKNYLKGVK